MEAKSKKSILPRITETVIGNVKYIVTAHFNEKGQTAEQIISQLINDRIEHEIKSAETTCFQHK